MNGVVMVKDSTMEWPRYDIFCPECGFKYMTFQDTHSCPARGNRVYDISDNLTTE